MKSRGHSFGHVSTPRLGATLSTRTGTMSRAVTMTMKGVRRPATAGSSTTSSPRMLPPFGNFWQFFGNFLVEFDYFGRFRLYRNRSLQVSTRFCSIFQNLPDYLADIFEIWHNFAQFCRFCNICKILLNFEFSRKLMNFQTDFLLKI